MKVTLAIAALLGLLSETEAAPLNQMVDQQDIQMLNSEFVEPEVEEDLEEEEDIELGETAEFAKMKDGCWAGIKRWTGKSNSWKTFDNAHKGSGKFEDPEFGAN